MNDHFAEFLVHNHFLGHIDEHDIHICLDKIFRNTRINKSFCNSDQMYQEDTLKQLQFKYKQINSVQNSIVMD